MKNLIPHLIIVAAALILFSFIQKPKNWDVPAEFKNMPNPVKKTEKVMAEGKNYYNQVCAGCHGTTGKGDGKKVKNKEIMPSSLVTDDVKKQTDGEHFYKIKYGRGVGNLHSFKGTLDDENIWAIVHYVKEFPKQ